MLQCFELLSGLRINFRKSSLYGYKVDVADMRYWASVLGCKHGSFPIQYLGVSLGLFPKSRLFWAPLKERLQRNLASWKRNYLNQAGKLVLLKSSLNSLPNYWFNLYSMPASIRSDIDRIRRCFFWGDDLKGVDTKRKLHLINWETLCLPKNAGGLNIGIMKLKNGAMLAKWLWRLYTERGRMWNELMVALYGKEIQFDVLQIKINTHSSPVIQSIRNLLKWDKMEQLVQPSAFIWSVRNGSKVLFWHDHWHHSGLLRVKLCKAFEVSRFKDGSVEKLISHLNLYGKRSKDWWLRALTSEEEAETTLFFDILQGIELKQGNDEVIWTPAHGSYSTQVCYNNLRASSVAMPVWGKIWNVKAPPKVQIFLWKFSHKVLPTKVLLRSRMPNFGLDDLCEWCLRGHENLDHIFFHCQVARWAWKFISEWWNVKFVPKDPDEVWKVINFQFTGSSLKKVWQVIVATALWSIWLIRNEKIFQNIRISREGLHHVILDRSFQWCLANDWVCSS